MKSHKSKFRKLQFVGAAACAALLFFTAFFIFSASAQQNKSIDVFDLAKAGFTNPVRHVMNNDIDNEQVILKYFKVQESVIDSHPDWGSVADLVAVLIRKMSHYDWSYNNGQMEIIDYNGRKQARLGKDGFYIVVTGPDQDKVVNLVNNLFNK